MAVPVLNFVIVGHEDHPIFEIDLANREGTSQEERAQYLHQVMQAFSSWYRPFVRAAQTIHATCISISSSYHSGHPTRVWNVLEDS